MCHAYRPFYSGFISERQNVVSEDEATLEVKGYMQELVQNLQSLYPHVQMSGLCIKGHINDIIDRQTQNPDVALIVMGTQGASGWGRKLLGSNTYAAIAQATVPVMAVPGSLKKFDFDRIGFTTNYHAAEITALQDFIDLMEEPPEVVVFHLYQNGKRKAQALMEQWRAKIRKMISFKGMECKIALVRDMIGGLNRFVKREKLDALVMTPFHKDFFSQLFHKDLVKAVAYQPMVPVLFMKES